MKKVMAGLYQTMPYQKMIKKKQRSVIAVLLRVKRRKKSLIFGRSVGILKAAKFPHR